MPTDPERAEGLQSNQRTYEAHAGVDGLFVVEGEGELVAQANAFLMTLTLRGFSPRTVRAYAHDLIVFFRWLNLRNFELALVDEGALLEYIAEQRRQAAKPRSINRRRAQYEGVTTLRFFDRLAQRLRPHPPTSCVATAHSRIENGQGHKRH